MKIIHAGEVVEAKGAGETVEGEVAVYSDVRHCAQSPAVDQGWATLTLLLTLNKGTLQGGASGRIQLGWLDFDFGLPGSADRKLAVLAEQLGKMVEHRS